jgi:hypothetical protein
MNPNRNTVAGATPVPLINERAESWNAWVRCKQAAWHSPFSLENVADAVEVPE